MGQLIQTAKVEKCPRIISKMKNRALLAFGPKCYKLGLKSPEFHEAWEFNKDGSGLHRSWQALASRKSHDLEKEGQGAWR